MSSMRNNCFGHPPVSLFHWDAFANDFCLCFLPSKSKSWRFGICRILQSLQNSQTRLKQVKLLQRRVNQRPGNHVICSPFSFCLLFFCWFEEGCLVYLAASLWAHVYTWRQTLWSRGSCSDNIKTPLIRKAENADIRGHFCVGAGLDLADARHDSTAWHLLEAFAGDIAYQQHWKSLRLDEFTVSSIRRQHLSRVRPETAPKNTSLPRNTTRGCCCSSVTLSRW